MAPNASQSRFLPSSFRISGLVKAWEAASRAASSSSIVSEPAPPERRVAVLKQTFLAKTPQAGLRTAKGLRTSRLTNVADTPGPAMPGRFPQTPHAPDTPGECDTPSSDAFMTPPQSNEEKAGHLAVPKTPESPTPQRDAPVDPPPMFKLKLTTNEPRVKCESTVGAEAVATLTTLDSHLPSPPPTPPTDLTTKDVEETELCAEPEPMPPLPAFKIYQEMAIQTDPIGVIVPMKRPKIALSTSGDSLAPCAKKPHSISPSVDMPGTNLSAKNLNEVKALLTSIESMDCVKGLTANLQQAKALLSEIASLDLLKNRPLSAAPPTLDLKEDSFVFLAPPAPPALIMPKKLAASEETDVESDGDSQDEDSHAQLFRVPPNSLASGICEAIPTRDSGGRRPRSLVIKTGCVIYVDLSLCPLTDCPRSDAWYLLKVPSERTEKEVADVRTHRREVSAQYSENKMKVCRGFVIAELKSFHQNERKLRPVGSVRLRRHIYLRAIIAQVIVRLPHVETGLFTSFDVLGTNHPVT